MTEVWTLRQKYGKQVENIKLNRRDFRLKKYIKIWEKSKTLLIKASSKNNLFKIMNTYRTNYLHGYLNLFEIFLILTQDIFIINVKLMCYFK